MISFSYADSFANDHCINMTMTSVLLVSTYFLVTITFVQSHSWLACTDYTEKNGGIWKADKCRGFSRGSHRKAPKNGVFGGDNGMFK